MTSIAPSTAPHSHISSWPDELLLGVFSLVPELPACGEYHLRRRVVALVRLAAVCARWRALAKDRSLWSCFPALGLELRESRGDVIDRHLLTHGFPLALDDYVYADGSNVETFVALSRLPNVVRVRAKPADALRGVCVTEWHGWHTDMSSLSQADMTRACAEITRLYWKLDGKSSLLGLPPVVPEKLEVFAQEYWHPEAGQWLQRLTSLTTLELTRFSHSQLPTILNAIPPTVVNLTLGSMRYREEEPLPANFRISPSITMLTLDSMDIPPRVLSLLASALPQVENLTMKLIRPSSNVVGPCAEVNFGFSRLRHLTAIECSVDAPLDLNTLTIVYADHTLFHRPRRLLFAQRVRVRYLICDHDDIEHEALSMEPFPGFMGEQRTTPWDISRIVLANVKLIDVEEALKSMNESGGSEAGQETWRIKSVTCGGTWSYGALSPRDSEGGNGGASSVVSGSEEMRGELRERLEDEPHVQILLVKD